MIITPITDKLQVLADRHRVALLTMLELLMGPRHEPHDPIATSQSHELIERFADCCDWQGAWPLAFLDEVNNAS